MNKDGICYIDGSKGAVVKHPFADRTLKDVCVSCYKSLTPVEEKESKIKRGKKYWGQTAIEKEFYEICMKSYPKMLSEYIAYCKGPYKACLLSQKPLELIH